MDDLISRKNLLQNIVKRLGIASEDYFTAQESVVISCIYNEPSAQPERKTGEWIEISSINHTYKCSECGRLLVNITDGKNNVAKNYPYCHCGADMRGEKDE